MWWGHEVARSPLVSCVRCKRRVISRCITPCQKVSRGQYPPLHGVWDSAPRKCFCTLYKVGRSTYGFVHGFCAWFWTWWFSSHGISYIHSREQRLCSNLGLVDWGLWMFWHVYIFIHCNVQRNIMKNQYGSPGFGILGNLYVFVLYSCHCLFSIF